MLSIGAFLESLDLSYLDESEVLSCAVWLILLNYIQRLTNFRNCKKVMLDTPQ